MKEFTEDSTQRPALKLLTAYIKYTCRCSNLMGKGVTSAYIIFQECTQFWISESLIQESSCQGPVLPAKWDRQVSEWEWDI